MLLRYGSYITDIIDRLRRGRIASLLREHDLAENMIAQYQAGAQQRVGG